MGRQLLHSSGLMSFSRVAGLDTRSQRVWLPTRPGVWFCVSAVLEACDLAAQSPLFVDEPYLPD